jgi:hypothetical protein
MDDKDALKVFVGGLRPGVSTRLLWEWLVEDLHIGGITDVFVNRPRQQFQIQCSAFVTFDVPWRAETAIGLIEGRVSEAFGMPSAGFALQASRAAAKNKDRNVMRRALASQEPVATPPSRPPLPFVAAPDPAAIAVSVASAVAAVEQTLRRFQLPPPSFPPMPPPSFPPMPPPSHPPTWALVSSLNRPPPPPPPPPDRPSLLQELLAVRPE